MGAWSNKEDPDNRTQYQESQGSGIAGEGEEPGQERERMVQKRKTEEGNEEEEEKKAREPLTWNSRSSI